ncbi:hypothetical protein M0R45_006298 [Rubus argutus]|uniref:Uncharacterized protein n=1 Tax=Rubus argutus TaxID=59490 RepID=A0AAW1YQ29_RUBAR
MLYSGGKLVRDWAVLLGVSRRRLETPARSDGSGEVERCLAGSGSDAGRGRRGLGSDDAVWAVGDRVRGSVSGAMGFAGGSSGMTLVGEVRS